MSVSSFKGAMVDPTTSRFWQVALKYGLLDEAKLERCWQALAPEKRTADAVDRRMARQAINQGWMTVWQAQQILTNRWQGLKIDRYLLLDVIGHGGMGRVYLARDTRLNRQVALKVLSAQRMRNTRALARFRREAKVGAQLQHENLVRVYDEGEAHGVNYLVMEFIQGKTVGHVIAESGKITPKIAANLGRQVALGLEHLNAKELLHRDVNPMNILIDRDGTAKLTDLGLAIDLGDMEDVVTRDGATVGTFDYISPEQARHSRTVDIRSDLYSLGCTLYHMISGHVPFIYPSLPEKLYAHQSIDPEPLAGKVAGVSDGLDAVVRRLMKKSADERYATPLEAAKALEPYASDMVTLEQIEAAILNGAEATPVSASVDGAPALAPAQVGPRAQARKDENLVRGSDPDLVATMGAGPAVVPGPSSSSDPLAFLSGIDFGPEQPLTNTRVSAEKTNVPSRVNWPRAGKIAAALLALVLVTWAISAWMRRQPAPDPIVPAPPVEPAVVQVGPSSSQADVTVRHADGTEVDAPSLSEAIRVASRSRSATITLRNKKPMRLDLLKDPIELRSSLIIQGAKEAAPALIVELAGKAAPIRVMPEGQLTISGVRFDVVVTGNRVNETPPQYPLFVDGLGNVTIDRCTFSATKSSSRAARVLSAAGLSTRLYGCLLVGFDQPIVYEAYPGTKLELCNCAIVRRPAGDILLGWATTAIARPGKAKVPPSLTFRRCTTVGGGLLMLQGFSPKAPLQVDVQSSAVRSPSLLMWHSPDPKSDFPSGLKWSGKDNRYDISGAAWVVLPPNGISGLPSGPSDLKSWVESAHPESGTTADPIAFKAASIAEADEEEQLLADLTIDTKDLGAETKRIGPDGEAEAK